MCHSEAMTTLAQARLAHWIDARFDRMAIGLSGLCAVHCVASALFLAFMASVGAALLNPLWHEIGLSFAILFGVVIAIVSTVRGLVLG